MASGRFWETIRVSNGLQFDEETSRKVEALYLTPDVVTQRGRVLRALELREGERVLDIGSGPGLLANEMAALVGPIGRACGIDISEDMLAMSRKRCADKPWTEFKKSDATNLPYPDGSFDAAVSTQVYEYVADIPQALAELYRVIRPGGRVVVLDTDYDSLVIYTESQARMERGLSAWNEHFVHAGLPARCLGNSEMPVSQSDNVTSSRCSIPNTARTPSEGVHSASWRLSWSDAKAYHRKRQTPGLLNSRSSTKRESFSSASIVICLLRTKLRLLAENKSTPRKSERGRGRVTPW